ncbi:hypothetical protein [Algibacter pacificus]|nr:hypothetical protein [Algibacter pacificus]
MKKVHVITIAILTVIFTANAQDIKIGAKAGLKFGKRIFAII